jgi:hypothetical protein
VIVLEVPAQIVVSGEHLIRAQVAAESLFFGVLWHVAVEIFFPDKAHTTIRMQALKRAVHFWEMVLLVVAI